MIEVRFDAITQVQYRVYTLCCQKLLDVYEELSSVCEIDAFVKGFDGGLSGSYCGEDYDLTIENVNLSLQKLANVQRSNASFCAKLEAIRESIENHKSNWDFCPPVCQLADTGKRLAQDFYLEGQRTPNLELIEINTPSLVFSNHCLSETNPWCKFSDLRPISTLRDGIYLPFIDNFGFWHYLSYPFLFFHEYVSHVYTPHIGSRTFEDGWLMYAIELYVKTRWSVLCQKHSLICAQLNVFSNHWIRLLSNLAQRGYELAENFDTWLGDNDLFFQYTWDLASYQFSARGSGSFHNDFLSLVRQYTHRSRGPLLCSLARSCGNALELYDRLVARL